MKKIMIAIMLCLSMTGMAQSEWERPDIQTQKSNKSVKAEKESSDEDAKYLAGAVPEVNGEVVWTLDLQVPGKNAQQIYDIVLNYLVDLVKQENQLEGSSVSLVNKQEHKIAASIKEWLVFKNQFLALDRAQLFFNLRVECSDNHITVDMRRINYLYEEERGDGAHFRAEEWITDKYALNKKGTKLYKGSGKFRKKTIDRKDELFEAIKNALQ